MLTENHNVALKDIPYLEYTLCSIISLESSPELAQNLQLSATTLLVASCMIFCPRLRDLEDDVKLNIVLGTVHGVETQCVGLMYCDKNKKKLTREPLWRH